MAGTRHHYIPRFLQAGFNSRPGERTQWAWLYRKGKLAPVEATLKHVSVEGSFYRYKTLDTYSSADAAITRAEAARLAPLVRRLRGMNVGPCADDMGVGELFAHIYARTRASWEYVESQASALISRIETFTGDPEAIRRILPALIEAQRPVIRKLLAPRYPGQDIDMLLTQTVAQIEIVTPEALTGDVARVIDPLVGYSLQVVQKTKVRSMQELSEKPEIARRFHDCAFHVLEFDGARLVQGDTPVVFCKIDGGFTPITWKDEPFAYAFLPLTPTRVVVANKIGRPDSWEVLREASIRCSYQHFIAAAPYAELDSLAHLIGAEFPAITQLQIERLFEEALALACTLGWLGVDEMTALEYLVPKVLPPLEDAEVSAAGDSDE